MNTEKMKQIIRHLMHEGVAGNLEPTLAHPGLQEIIPTIQHLNANTRDRQLQIPLQFAQGDWVATIQRMSYIATGQIFGDIQPGQHASYEVITFAHFEGDEIVQQHSQADFMTIRTQAEGKNPVQHQYVQTNEASLSPDDACALIRHLIQEGVKGNFDALEEHPAFKHLIPIIESQRASTSKLEVSFPVEFSDGEWVATRSYWKQTAKGEMFGLDATGKEIEFEVLMVHRIEDGKVVDARTMSDVGTIMRQLGVEA